jgi:RNA polymerase sigma-70 factor (ECF subfamily)
MPMLIQEAKRGDVRAFEEIYRLYKGRVYALCVRVTKSIPDSEDLTQEVFIQVRRKLHSFRGDSAFSTWLYKVAFNRAMMFLRRRRADEPSLDLSCVGEAPGGLVWQPPFYGNEPVRRLALLRAIASLPTGGRTVVILHDVNGLTHREVGLLLGIAPTTSKTRLHHAHVTLRLLLNASHPLGKKTSTAREAISTSEHYV